MQDTQIQFLGLEDPPGEGNGNPFQYSCLENTMHRGVIGPKSWTHLGDCNDDNMISLLNYFIQRCINVSIILFPFH